MSYIMSSTAPSSEAVRWIISPKNSSVIVCPKHTQVSLRRHSHSDTNALKGWYFWFLDDISARDHKCAAVRERNRLEIFTHSEPPNTKILRWIIQESSEPCQRDTIHRPTQSEGQFRYVSSRISCSKAPLLTPSVSIFLITYLFKDTSLIYSEIIYSALFILDILIFCLHYFINGLFM